MNTIVNIKIFNDILDQFIDYVEEKFPMFKSDLILTRSTLILLRKGNPRMVVENFMYYVLPYSKQIEDCDERFFLNVDNLTNLEKNKDNLMFISKIKDIWTCRDISDINKAHIWMYFKKLLIAGNRVV